LALSVVTDAQWKTFVEHLGAPSWSADPELATRAGRRSQADRLDAELRPWFAQRDRDACVEELVAAGIPAAPVADPRVSNQHAQLRAREFYESCEHPVAGQLRLPTLPYRYASVERWIRTAAPTLGQHNREILSELGLGDEEITALEEQKIIGSKPEGL
jgi:crotonobetainyl-CoA:carnitine CoA-transferase CaiB-like acyl-CoA transferase